MDEAVLLANGRLSVHRPTPAEALVYLQGVYWPEARLPRPASCRWPEAEPFCPRRGEVWAELMPVLVLTPEGGPQRWRLRPSRGTALGLRPGHARWWVDPVRAILVIAWRGGPWNLALRSAGMRWRRDPGRADTACLQLDDVRVEIRIAGAGARQWEADGLVLHLAASGRLQVELEVAGAHPALVGARAPLPPMARVSWPMPALERLHRQAPYRLLGAQDPQTGAISPGLVPETWSGHVFWDSLFAVRALLELGAVDAAKRGVDFFAMRGERWRAYAAAQGRPGWRWPWEMTPGGVEALGRHVHLRQEVHNQAAVIRAMAEVDDWLGERARGAHAEAIVEGTRYLVSLLGGTPGGHALPDDVVGVDERPGGRYQDPATLAGIAAALRTALAVAGDAVPAEWVEVEAALTRAAESILEQMLTGSAPLSIAPLLCLDPYRVWDPASEPAQALVTRFVQVQRDPPMIGHGVSADGFPWAVGVVARLRALAGDGDAAGCLLASVAPWISAAGDVPETVTPSGHIRARHFVTAHAALVSAMHAMLVRRDGPCLTLFPAWPRGWPPVRFTHLRTAAFDVSFEPGRNPPWQVTAPAGSPPPTVRRAIHP